MKLLKLFKRKKQSKKLNNKKLTPDEIMEQMYRDARVYKVEQIYGEGVNIDLPGWRKEKKWKKWQMNQSN